MINIEKNARDLRSTSRETIVMEEKGTDVVK